MGYRPYFRLYEYRNGALVTVADQSCKRNHPHRLTRGDKYLDRHRLTFEDGTTQVNPIMVREGVFSPGLIVVEVIVITIAVSIGDQTWTYYEEPFIGYLVPLSSGGRLWLHVYSTTL